MGRSLWVLTIGILAVASTAVRADDLIRLGGTTTATDTVRMAGTSADVQGDTVLVRGGHGGGGGHFGGGHYGGGFGGYHGGYGGYRGFSSFGYGGYRGGYYNYRPLYYGNYYRPYYYSNYRPYYYTNLNYGGYGYGYGGYSNYNSGYSYPIYNNSYYGGCSNNYGVSSYPILSNNVTYPVNNNVTYPIANNVNYASNATISPTRAAEVLQPPAGLVSANRYGNYYASNMTVVYPTSQPTVIGPATGTPQTLPTPRTFPYDGGPANPIPMPGTNDVKSPKKLANPAEGLFVSLTTDTTGDVSLPLDSYHLVATDVVTPRASSQPNATSTKIQYRAYGDPIR